MAETFFPDNVEFDVSETRKLLKSRDVWRISSIAGWATAGLGAIAMFTSHIFTEPPNPVTVKVDRFTGTTETVVGYDIPKSSSKDFELMARANLIEYVRCRVGFTRGEAQTCYDRVTYQSSGPLKAEWDSIFNPDKNPNAPLKLYAAADQIRVSNASVSFLPTNNANEVVGVVRFDREMRLQTAAPTTRRMNATITFKYDKNAIPEKNDAIYLNPLGFSVLNWRTDLEGSEKPLVEVKQ